jgi:hypothetical protein
MIMKTIFGIHVALLLLVCSVQGQGQFLYDQEATTTVEGAAPWSAANQPMGQSFSPTLSSIGFVELNLFDSDALNHAGATVLVNVRATSLTGTILGFSSSVFIPDGFFGITSFIFSTPISLTPGTTYYLQPVIQSGDHVSSFVTDGSYSGGMEFLQGSSVPTRDLWFREGIVVPEPSSFTLFLIAGGVALNRGLRAKRAGRL